MLEASTSVKNNKKILEILQGSFWDADPVARVAHQEFGEGVGLATTTTYTYATNTPAYLNPHAVATTTAASATRYTYDNNGNLTSTAVGTSTTASFTWDYNNRMTQAVGNSATSTYSYDPGGQRVSMTVATTSSATTYYPTKGYNITGNTPTKHIFLPDGTMIATVVGTGTSTTVSYIHTDHLGGSNVITNDAGEVAQLTDYYPYGNTRLDEKTSFNEQRKFTGHEYDSSTGLSYMNARYYNPTIGKFVSVDAAFLAAGDESQIQQLTRLELQQYLSDPQGMNSYSYARNNPLTNIDATGNYWFFAKTRASRDIRNNSENIKNAADMYNDVTPSMVASVIYQERLGKGGVNPFDMADSVLGLLGVDTSIGLGQVKISTAAMLVNKGYVDKEKVGIKDNFDVSYVNSLRDDKNNTIFVAAYLQYLIDEWKDEYPDIVNDIGVLSTLYNQGVGEPHSDPESSQGFGIKAQQSYTYVKSLLEDKRK